MIAIIPVFDETTKRPYYLQLYDHIKQAITTDEMHGGEKLPSLRALSKSLRLSVTTIDLAYAQLTVEGYIFSKPQSGYYVSEIGGPGAAVGSTTVMPPRAAEPKQPRWDGPSPASLPAFASTAEARVGNAAAVAGEPAIDPAHPVAAEQRAAAAGGRSCYAELFTDSSCFDFNKWKKCTNKILTECSGKLLRESDPQGEQALRAAIAQYLLRSRGVYCSSGQIVIGAGTQALMGQLCLLLRRMSINYISLEEPGYLPVRNIFRDRGFAMSPVPVTGMGIEIDRLPSNIRSAVYVSPSNQFPTGAVMPVARRYRLLEWARGNDSIIIEDDYDSELRYFGKPIPALQGLDTDASVVYLGSFSATLFPAIKISYMVLPERMAAIFREISGDYTQTCSKMEQLTLADFMEQGLYQIHIKKLRKLYAQKLTAIGEAFRRYSGGRVRPVSMNSGISLITAVRSESSAEVLCRAAIGAGVMAVPFPARFAELPSQAGTPIILYYNQIPLEKIDETVQDLIRRWLPSETDNLKRKKQ